MKFRALLTLLIIAALQAGGTAAIAGDNAPKSFEQAQKMAEARGVPLLLKMEADWCGSCAAFQKTFESDEEFRKAASTDVVLFRVDGEKGEGVDLARTYGVVVYPTFILANSSGDLMDSWMGYKHPEKFLQAKSDALSDLTTIAEKLNRFRESPSEADAVKLGDLRQTFGYPAEAVAYYKRAQALNPDSETNHDLRILGAMARGVSAQLYTTQDIRHQTDAVFASASDAKTQLSAYYTLRKVAHKTHMPEITYPYLRMAYETAVASDDKYAVKAVSKLAPDYALHIERNPAKAVAARKDAMPENWMEDGRSLNQVAWWCFENRINLAEAEEFARRGVELAAAGRDKANVLDTLAEICNLNNNCHNAVQYIRMAINEDPENEYFQNQLNRFQEILAQNQ